MTIALIALAAALYLAGMIPTAAAALDVETSYLEGIAVLVMWPLLAIWISAAALWDKVRS